jgi:hypothetical protein
MLGSDQFVSLEVQYPFKRSERHITLTISTNKMGRWSSSFYMYFMRKPKKTAMILMGSAMLGMAVSQYWAKAEGLPLHAPLSSSTVTSINDNDNDNTSRPTLARYPVDGIDHRSTTTATTLSSVSSPSYDNIPACTPLSIRPYISSRGSTRWSA